MQTIFRAIILAAAVAFAPSASFAADLAVAEPAPLVSVPSFSWTGAYVGAYGAYHDGTIRDTGCVGACVKNHKVKDPYLAIQAGYDYQLDSNIVIGAFGWVAVTRINSSAQIAPGVTVKGRTDFGGFVGGRVGYAVDRFLPYVFGGYEYVHGKVKVPAAPLPKEKQSHDGFGFGGGVEFAVTDNISVDARYMYSRLSKEKYNFGGGVTNAGERADTFSLGVNYRFGS